MAIERKSLVREHLLYIGGGWRAGEGGGAGATSPATGEVFARDGGRRPG
jgi:hypothetical protein